MKNSPKQYAFWKYDLFPYVLWCEVEKIEDGKVYLKGWGNSYRKVNSCMNILGEQKAVKFIKELSDLKRNYNNCLETLKKRSKNLRERLEDA